jgi:hypothetical protein
LFEVKVLRHFRVESELVFSFLEYNRQRLGWIG